MIQPHAPILHTLQTLTDGGMVICNHCGWETETDDGKIRTIESCPNCNPDIKTTLRETLRIPHGDGKWTVLKGKLVFFSLDNGVEVCYNMTINRTYTNVSEKFAMEA